MKNDADSVVVDGYQITEHLRKKWEQLRKTLFSTLTGDWNASTDPHLTLQTATNQQFARLVASYILRFVDAAKPYGTELFNTLCRLTITVCIEVVCLRRNPETGDIEVLMSQRPETESAYPGEWHCPGTAKRIGESDDHMFARIGKGEFWSNIVKKVFLFDWDNPHEARGHWFHRVYLCIVEEGTRGTWFAVNNLPAKTIDHHRDILIPGAVKAFENLELLEAGQYLANLALGVESLGEDKVRLAVAAALDLKEPLAPMGTRLYDSFTPHATNIAAEGVAFRTRPDGIEVLLEKRPPGDKWFSGQWAGLGVGFRNTDTGAESALARLVAKEFKVPTKFEFVDDVYPPFTGVERGWYECKLFLAFPEGEPGSGQWFPADPLPADTADFKIVTGHRENIIPVALTAYKKKMEGGR